MKRISLLCILFILSSAVFGQIVNIENKRIYEDTSGWSGSIDGSFAITQNGPTLFSFGVRPRIQHKTRKNYYLLISDLIYTASNEVSYANQGMLHFRYARRIDNGPWKWESYAQVQYNILLNQRLRLLGGTGLRLKVVDTMNVRFFAGSSVFYEYEELTEDGMINSNVRWSTYLSWFISTKSGFNFTGITYIQPRLDLLEDYRFSGQYSLSQAINKRLDLRFEFNLFYDAVPPSNIRKTVFSTSAGFKVKLGE